MATMVGCQAFVLGRLDDCLGVVSTRLYRSARTWRNLAARSVDQAVVLRALDRNLGAGITADVLHLEEMMACAHGTVMIEHLNLLGPWTKHPRATVVEA